MEIVLQKPEWYMDRLQQGCILDPSVFYSAQHVRATMDFVQSVMPKRVLLPSNVYDALVEKRWLSFMQTLTLWSARYEDTPDAWKAAQDLFERLRATPIAPPKEDIITQQMRRSLEYEDKPLHQTIYELVASSIQSEMPIFACEFASYRLIDFLRGRFETIVVEPSGRWREHKRQRLAQFAGQPLMAMKLAVAALLFVTAATTESPLTYGGASMTLAITIIDG